MLTISLQNVSELKANNNDVNRFVDFLESIYTKKTKYKVLVKISNKNSAIFIFPCGEYTYKYTAYDLVHKYREDYYSVYHGNFMWFTQKLIWIIGYNPFVYKFDQRISKKERQLIMSAIHSTLRNNIAKNAPNKYYDYFFNKPDRIKDFKNLLFGVS